MASAFMSSSIPFPSIPSTLTFAWTGDIPVLDPARAERHWHSGMLQAIGFNVASPLLVTLAQPANHGPQGNKDQKNGNNPNGNAPAASESKSVTITINADTTVSTAGSQTALTIADITVGQQVSVTVTGDETSGYTATAIEVLQNQPNASTAVEDNTETEASETESSDT